MTATSPRGTRPRRLGVAACSTRCMMAASLGASNGFLPLTMVKNRMPRLQMSSSIRVCWPCQRCGLV
jgi:hypothetical protein